MINIDEVIPKIMYLIKFRGAMSIDSMHYLTSYGKATIRNALQSMIKNGLIRKTKEAKTTYELSKNSKYWLGWKTERGWAESEKK